MNEKMSARKNSIGNVLVLGDNLLSPVQVTAGGARSEKSARLQVL